MSSKRSKLLSQFEERPNDTFRTRSFKFYVREVSERARGNLSHLVGVMLTPQNTVAPYEDGYKPEPLSIYGMGNTNWTMLHTIAAHYPEDPSPVQQNAMRTLLTSTAQLFPCGVCSGNFLDEIQNNPPLYESRESVNTWLCNYHNKVNARSFRPQFDCRNWERRWYYNEACD